jgi:hypothetical protein
MTLVEGSNADNNDVTESTWQPPNKQRRGEKKQHAEESNKKRMMVESEQSTQVFAVKNRKATMIIRELGMIVL